MQILKQKLKNVTSDYLFFARFILFCDLVQFFLKLTPLCDYFHSLFYEEAGFYSAAFSKNESSLICNVIELF